MQFRIKRNLWMLFSCLCHYTIKCGFQITHFVGRNDKSNNCMLTS